MTFTEEKNGNGHLESNDADFSNKPRTSSRSPRKETLAASFFFWLDVLRYSLIVAFLDGAKFIYELCTSLSSYLPLPWTNPYAPRGTGAGLNSISVAVDTTPTFFAAFWRHMVSRARKRSSLVPGRASTSPDEELSYSEGLELVKQFLQFASTHTVEELQSFTGKETPTPAWVVRSVVELPKDTLDAAASLLTTHLEIDDPGLVDIGGKNWWRLRCRPLYGEWIEMRRDVNARDACIQAGLEPPPTRVILYLHGGAHYFAGNGTHRYQIQRHARKLNARAFSVSFRLAPQYPFPCSLLDALSAYLYLIAPPPDSGAQAYHPHEIMLYGDSSGGGLALALLVLLRDAGLPLPAGSCLISPWVDLTHSFPSLMTQDTGGDYIPPTGFQFRPSLAWPPTREDPLVFKDVRVQQAGRQGSNSHKHQPKQSTELVVQEQIQLYCTNKLIGHPLISLINQGSLGGLPPLLIIGGSAELLADEIVYVAHKAANPEKYYPADETLKKYPAQREKLSQYPPTRVQLQMFDDCCHVATTLSFTTPAKFQYRSCAKFSLWALSEAAQEAERKSEEVLANASAGQSHFDYATNKPAQSPPQQTSPQRFRLDKSFAQPRASKANGVANGDASRHRDDERANGHAQDDDDDDEPNEEADLSTGTIDGHMERSLSSSSSQDRRNKQDVLDRLDDMKSDTSVSTAEVYGRETPSKSQAGYEGSEGDEEEGESSDDEPEKDRKEAKRINLSRGTSSTSFNLQRNPSANGDPAEKEDIQAYEQVLISSTGEAPPFENSMVRQRVTPDGYARPMEAEDELAALTMDRNLVGHITPDGPIRRWLEKRREWDKQFKRDLIDFRKIRMKDRRKAEKVGYLPRDLHEDRPPVSSVIGMYDEQLAWQTVQAQDTSIGTDGQTERAGLGMLLWSKLSSKPDAEQQGRKTIDELAAKGNQKMIRRPSSIKTPDMEKEIEH